MYPNQKAGFRSRDARARWEASFNSGDDSAHTFRNPQLQVPQVPVVIAAGEDLVLPRLQSAARLPILRPCGACNIAE
ncbi:Uncharacterised protein [Klebsiella michiganensis]|uniref:Uncharacterized protein n=1 Tax=Klebsiella michiganensis TaxID=1134687 RepID=A0A7H4MZX0_9ENTR|nr:Uncharacterised protein [Klebsiella michiganensis]